MSSSLSIIVHNAQGLEDVETMGKNDPYVRLTLELQDKDAYKKTTVKKNAGRNAEWDERLILDNFHVDQDPYLYVEVLESDTGIDPPIGFTAIPLSQVVNSPNKATKAEYQLYTANGKEKGNIVLTIAVVGDGHSAPEHSLPQGVGRTEILSDHKQRVEKMKSHEKAGDAAGAVALLAGLYGIKKLRDGSRKQVPKEQ
ncbi:hypothetical protein BG004_000796 [Podila humilis]|nr:hypothetical protein BG004_000796 [Podila humilis]